MQANLLKGKIYEKGLNVVKLADLMGMPRSKLSLRISGKIKFKLDECIKIKEILKLSPEEFENIFLRG